MMAIKDAPSKSIMDPDCVFGLSSASSCVSLSHGVCVGGGSNLFHGSSHPSAAGVAKCVNAWKVCTVRKPHFFVGLQITCSIKTPMPPCLILNGCHGKLKQAKQEKKNFQHSTESCCCQANFTLCKETKIVCCAVFVCTGLANTT